MLTWLTEVIPSRPLGLARILVGSAAVARGLVAWNLLASLVQSETLKVPYADWAPSPTVPVAAAIVAAWLVASIAFTLGWRVPVSGTVLLAALGANLLLDQQLYSNHLYLMVWMVLLLTLAGAGSGLNIRRIDEAVVRWPVLLLMLQVTIVYGFSALTKINADFLSGEVLARVLQGGFISLPESLRSPEFLGPLAGLVIVVEMFVALFLWSPRFRPAAIVLGLGLHLSIILLMAHPEELAIFALEMLAIYPLFLRADPFEITAPDEGWRRRLARYDLLHLANIEVVEGLGELNVTRGSEHWVGARGHTRVLEHSVPWLWIAPLRRLGEIGRGGRTPSTVDAT